jgi:hypothetical protein
MSIREFSAQDIDAAYTDLGHQYGWSFMATPAERLHTAQVAIVGLNPGGGGEGDTYEYGRFWASDGVNAYYDEQWGTGGTDTPLQTQVKEWHRLLGLKPADPLCIQFVPFRSPDWKRLPEKKASIDFARSLWRWVLDVTPARLFLTMGKLPAAYLVELMDAKLVARLPTGWGNKLIDAYDTPDGRRVVGMPHPSRYQLFNRGEASETANESFRAATASGA